MIGDRIRQRRIELGMTQEELAKKLGYKSKSSINKIEMGKTDINQTKIRQFAKALNTTEKELMGWVDTQAIMRDLERLYNEDAQKNGQQDSYYLNEDARELAQFLMENPAYKELFDASRKVKASDITIVKQLLDRFGGNEES